MLKLQNVSKYYSSNEVVALGLRKVNLDFDLGEFVAVTGESGSGKSTLLNVISGLDSYEDGEMYVNGEETSYFSIEEWEAYRRQYIGFVFQSYNIIDSYSVLENVLIALTIQGYDKATRKERALKLIDRVGLSSHVHHKASKLSGGQKQRCVIARALAKDCPIIVADEPTGNLDSESSKNILTLLKEISKDKLVIVVTHSFEEIAEYATRKIRLFDGEVVEDKIIKKHDEVEVTNHVESYKMTLINLIGISIRNLFRTPRRTIFTLIVSVFIVIVFTFSYGSYTSQTSSLNDDFYFGYFDNVNESRIVVTKFGNLAFTPAEIQKLRDVEDVLIVIEDDVINDSLIYAYAENSYNGETWVEVQENFINPAVILTTEDLKKGTYPSSEFEVVIQEKDGYSVGDTIELGYSHPDYESGTESLPSDTITFTISGVVTQKSGMSWRGQMYFHEDFINSDIVYENAYSGDYKDYIQATFTYNQIELDYFPLEYIHINDSLADGKIEASQEKIENLVHIVDEDFVFGVDVPDVSDLAGIEFEFVSSTAFEKTIIPVEITGVFTSPLDSKRYSMNQNTFDALNDEEKYQVTVMVRDAFVADDVIADVQALGFNAIYPISVGNELTAIIAILTSVYLGILLGFLMLIIYFISYIVLKNVQNSKKKDYLIFRSIGASKKDLNRVTIIELFLSTVMAYVLTMGLLAINEQFDTFIPQYLRFFTVGSYFFIFMLLSILAVLLGNRFNKKIFSNSVITSLKQD